MMEDSRLKRIQALMDKVDDQRMQLVMPQEPQSVVDATLDVYRQQGIAVDRALVEKASKAALPHRLPLPVDLESAQSRRSMKITFGGIFASIACLAFTGTLAVNTSYTWVLPVGGALAALGLGVSVVGVMMGAAAGAAAPDFNTFKAQARVNLIALLAQASLDQIENLLCHSDLTNEVQALARTELLQRKRALANSPAAQMGY